MEKSIIFAGNMYVKDCLEQNYIDANFIEDIDFSYCKENNISC